MLILSENRNSADDSSEEATYKMTVEELELRDHGSHVFANL